MTGKEEKVMNWLGKYLPAKGFDYVGRIEPEIEIEDLDMDPSDEDDLREAADEEFNIELPKTLFAGVDTLGELAKVISDEIPA